MTTGRINQVSIVRVVDARPSVKNRRRPSTTPSSRQRHPYSDSVISQTTHASTMMMMIYSTRIRVGKLDYSINRTQNPSFYTTRVSITRCGAENQDKVEYRTYIFDVTIQLTDTVFPDVVKLALSFNRFERSFTDNRLTGIFVSSQCACMHKVRLPLRRNERVSAWRWHSFVLVSELSLKTSRCRRNRRESYYMSSLHTPVASYALFCYGLSSSLTLNAST